MPAWSRFWPAALAALALAPRCAASPAPGPAPPAESRALARAILRELVAIDSTHAHGSTVAAEAVAARLVSAGFPRSDVQVLAPPGLPTKGNAVVRLRGSGAGGRPLLYVGHLDVVEARRENWTYDPFSLTEADGWLYGRGTVDMKGQDAAMIAALIRLRNEGFRPARDVIVAFTADEEAGGDANGVEWLLEAHRDLVDAGLAINPDGGEAALRNGRRLYLSVETSEKLYATWRLEAVGPGGHSSRPTPANPIYRMSRALARLEAKPFPVRLTDTVRAYFRARAELETGRLRQDLREAAAGSPSPDALRRLSADPELNALLRTTCEATMIEGGQGESALPERARTIIQCRVMPGEDVDGVRQALATAIADPAIRISAVTAGAPSPDSPLSPQVMGPVDRVVREMWPGTPVLPIMSPGTSDSAITRSAGIASYVVDGIFQEIDDDRAHAPDERIGVQAFDEEVEFTYRLMKALAGAP
jgi:acetylornithine deacetylase/succinyl-diaminopimelate desuccinylase-like protein